MPRPTSKRSIVWTFFDVTDDKKNITCKLCKKTFPNHGNTSNSKEHLKRIHPIQLSAEEDRRGLPVRQNSALPNSSSSTPGISGTSQVEPQRADQRQEPVAKNTRQLRLYAKISEITTEESASLDKAVVRLISKDYQPISIVEDSGFRNLVKKLNPNYTLPSRKTVSEKLLPAFYKAHVEELKNVLKDVEHLSLTSDYWKARNEKTFISLLTLHL